MKLDRSPRRIGNAWPRPIRPLSWKAMAVIARRIWTPEVMRELWDTPSPFYALITGKRPEPPRKPAPPRVVPLRSRKAWRRVARVVLS